MAEAVKKEEEKKKGPIGKLKELSEDKEEQMAILSTFVRLGILIWAGGILTLNYVQFPGLSKQDNIDPTFIASVFTGVLATFGVEAGQRKNKSSASGGGARRGGSRQAFPQRPLPSRRSLAVLRRPTAWGNAPCNAVKW